MSHHDSASVSELSQREWPRLRRAASITEGASTPRPSFLKRTIQALKRLPGKLSRGKRRSRASAYHAFPTSETSTEGLIFRKLKHVSLELMGSDDGYDTEDENCDGMSDKRHHRNGMDLGPDGEELARYRSTIMQSAADGVLCVLWGKIAIREVGNQG